MAGDWIKMRSDLATDPAVIRMADLLGMDSYSVVGRLHAVWGWADAHCDGHGAVTLVPPKWLDTLAGRDGFAAALEAVGWLIPGPSGFSFPRFDRHMGHGAKVRAQAAERQRKSRRGKGQTRSAPPHAPSPAGADSRSRPGHAPVTHESRPCHAPSVTREEKRREEYMGANAPIAAAEPTPAKKAARPKPPAGPRPRNPIFDAIADVTGTDPATAGGLIGAVAAALAQADPPYTPDDVRDFGRRFWELCPWAQGERDRPTPKELQNHVGKLRAGPSGVLPGPPPRPPVAMDRGAAAEARAYAQIQEAMQPR